MNPNIKRWETRSRWVEVDLDRCVGTGNCEATCPAGVYHVIDGIVDARNIGNCISCEQCKIACPSGAIIAHHAWT
ncbi:MAG TPA: 4Fe-4S binding protein [Candidatus Lokiarchaeia archaeon]|nr:4Fe-4S binding protein [Candidatus Lokiarchaeia archaeon]